MLDRRFGVLLAVLALTALTGCTQSRAGEASPAERPEANALPPRPEQRPLDGITGCQLLTRAQRAELKVSAGRQADGRWGEFDAKTCNFGTHAPDPLYDYGITTVTNNGAGYWLGPNANVDTQLTKIAGFPAVAFKLRGTRGGGCGIAVDVADGQMLIVDMLPITRHVFDQNQQCDMAADAAKAALHTLETLK